MGRIERRAFLAAGSIGALAAATDGFTRVRFGDDATGLVGGVRVPPGRVSEFVGACHARPDDVRSMLLEDPALARASWDWGFGDWEAAIGACSHTGRTDIIELLLAHGARPDVFTMATLDEVDAVRAFVRRVQNAKAIDGPHDISLFRHAKAGDAKRVMDYLTSEGLDDDRNRFQTDPAARRFVGVYAWGLGPSQRLEIKWVERLSCLSLLSGDEPARNLAPLADNPGQTGFRPAGSAGATVTFVTDDRVVVRYLARETGAERVA
jgi:hypothetical protein